MIELCDYARHKISLMESMGFNITEDEIKDAVRTPSNVVDGRKARKIAQKPISSTHLIRVIYEEKENKKLVVTFYPARRERYESKL